MLNKALVLLPGWGFKPTIWEPVLSKLSAQPIVSLNLLDLFNENSSQENLLEHICKTMAAKIPNNAILMGWSLGGLIASYFCAQYSHKCAALITTNFSPKFVASTHWPGIPPAAIIEFQQLAQNNLPRLLKKFALLVSYPNSDRNLQKQVSANCCDVTDSNKLNLLLELLISENIQAHLANINCPTLAIFGENDALVPPSIAKEMQTIQPNIVTRIITGAGHIPFLSHPLLFAELVNNFIITLSGSHD